MDLVRTAEPEADVLELADVKMHLRVDEDDDAAQDDLIEALIAAATDYLDGYSGVLGRCLISQTWKLRFDYCFPSWRIPLPLAPLISVDAIEYVDAEGVTQTLSPSVYQVIDGPAAAVQPAYGQAWPAPRSQARAVTITFTAGYGATADKVPAPLRAAMKLLVAHLFEHREAVVGVDNRDSSAPLPLGVDALVAPYRARSIA